MTENYPPPPPGATQSAPPHPVGENPAPGPGYAQQAAQAVGAVQQPDQGTDAGQSIDEMTRLRAGLTDYETKLQAMMKQAEDQQAAWQQQFESMSRQLATVRQQAGPPTAVLAADALATRVKNIASANPDLGDQHFAGLISQTEQLADEVKAVAGGTGDLGRVEQIAAGIEQWFTRIHQRISGKNLEGIGAALDEAAHVAETAAELAAKA